jgi:hypothetical protein
MNTLIEITKQCIKCQSYETYIDKRGHERWCHDEEGNIICKKCYMKHINNPKWNPIHNKRRYNNVGAPNLNYRAISIKKYNNPITIKKNSLKFNPIINAQRQKFKGLSKSMGWNPHKYVCSKCGAIKGIDCKQTHMHHWFYLIIMPWACCEELCVSCHKKLKELNR